MNFKAAQKVSKRVLGVNGGGPGLAEDGKNLI